MMNILDFVGRKLNKPCELECGSSQLDRFKIKSSSSTKSEEPQPIISGLLSPNKNPLFAEFVIDQFRSHPNPSASNNGIKATRKMVSIATPESVPEKKNRLTWLTLIKC